MWDRVVASNEESWEAGEERFQRKNLRHAQRAYHSLLWLTYGYLQQERFEEAKKMVDIIEDDAKHHTSGRAKVHLNQMRAAYLVNSREWGWGGSRYKSRIGKCGIGEPVTQYFY